MKDKKRVENILRSADEKTAEYIAQMSPPVDETTKEHIYAMTQQRLMQKNGSEELSGESFHVTVTRKPAWIHTAATAAACLLIALALTGGAVVLQRSANSTPNPEFAEQTSQVQTTTAATEPEIPKEWSKEDVYILKIVDRTKEEDLVIAEELEKIHEDEKNEYFLGGIYSHYVIVHYSDGNQEDIKSALQSGRATIADLDRFGINYYTESKESTEPPTETTEETATSSTTENISSQTGLCSHPLQSTTTKPLSPSINASIVKIVDRAKEEGMSVPSALEKIHEDDKNEYFFSGMYSQYVIVHYSDGTQEGIKSALQSGRATIADLDRFGINYYTEPKESTEPPTETTGVTTENSYPVCSHPLQSTTTKPVNVPTNRTIVKIVNRAKEEGLPVLDAEEKIFEDDKNEYFFSGMYSQYVIVHYSDGNQEDIKSALQSGRATIADLDRFGIHYWTEPKVVQKPDVPKLHPLYEKYPEYFNLSTFKGLEVYVWQMSGNSYRCGVLSGTNRLKTEDEITALMMNGATIEEMKEILSVYGIGRNEVFIMPVRNPVSSYWYEIDQEYQEKVEALFWED